ncbi:hypothetical protein D3C87_1259990 [compost metagenome]
MKIQHQVIVTLIVVAGFFCCPAQAQQTYLSGTAKASIEPETYPFSVALAGYGYPRGGRFSLEWVKKEGSRKLLFSENRKQKCCCH